MQWQGRSVRKSTGGRYRKSRGKKSAELARAPADTHIGEDRRKILRTFGSNHKVRALRAMYATVANTREGWTRRALIETVEENTANPNYVRRNLLNRGAIIRTEEGRARIVSRPGQHGVINAVLIE
ncbi:MAG: 30S ribosomal protein S8e [Methanomicrobiaceae archaeon]|uniref:30S ribosomal protein S8e n=1 Tax=hydrocarbon metagenome TaxID=938273 RepID=A0A0W8FG09_9ZZZZ|nr:30S ribosomal protein S8e [Methanomicrobiaceae archaeon]MDD5419069.1 30S ribosomal protein S8e [Methanomicrobiaceae archaeon]